MPWNKEWWQRPGLAVIGLTCVWYGYAIWMSGDTGFGDHYFWCWWFVASGVATWVFVLRPWSVHWMKWSGAMVNLAVISRSMALVIEAAEGYGWTSTDWRRLGGAAMYALLAVILTTVWAVYVATYTKFRRLERERQNSGRVVAREASRA